MRTGVKRSLFAVVAVLIAVAVTTGVLLGVDVYLHGKYERSGGFNVWGYRGHSAGRKKPGEYRVVVLGGSSAYGYGVTADEALPAVLERQLRMRTTSPAFTVINLGYNNEGAYSFRTTLEDYRWLKYDLAILYEGYNDMNPVGPNLTIFRHQSPVFRLTGYMPIFPIIFEEKSAVMLTGGDAGAFYRKDNKTVFHASLATRAGAGVLGATADVARALEAQLGRVSAEPSHAVDSTATAGCSARWGVYCHSMAVAIEYARQQGAQVIVGGQPFLRVSFLHDMQAEQQTELREMVKRRFGGDAAIRYVGLGDQIDLENPKLAFDHMHLTEAGNRAAGALLVQPVLDMAAQKAPKTS